MNEALQKIKDIANGNTGSIPKAIFYLVFGMSIFSIMDVIIKNLSDTYPAHEIVFFRGIVAMMPILLIIYIEGGFQLLKSQKPKLQIIRGLLGFCAFTAYYLALAALPIADVVTIFFASPLFISIFGYWFLSEEVGVHRWSAITIGFLGVLVMTKPGFGTFDPALLLAVFAAAFYASTVILTRVISRHDRGSTQAFYSMGTFIIASAAVGAFMGNGKFYEAGNASTEFLLRAWSVPTGFDSLLLIAAGVIAGFGFYCLTQAYREAPVSVVAPFEYISLPWAILWGFVFFGDLPSGTTYLGLTLIVGSGLYIIYRESVLGRRLVRGRRSRLQI